MKIKILSTLLVFAALGGCSKQEPVTTATDSVTSAQFEKLDTVIDGYLDKLDNSNTPMTERKQILCIDYPNTYNKEYAPLLLKNSPQDYTQAKLDQDLKLALDYYKGKGNIQC